MKGKLKPLRNVPFMDETNTEYVSDVTMKSFSDINPQMKFRNLVFCIYPFSHLLFCKRSLRRIYITTGTQSTYLLDGLHLIFHVRKCTCGLNLCCDFPSQPSQLNLRIWQNVLSPQTSVDAWKGKWWKLCYSAIKHQMME